MNPPHGVVVICSLRMLGSLYGPHHELVANARKDAAEPDFKNGIGDKLLSDGVHSTRDTREDGGNIGCERGNSRGCS